MIDYVNKYISDLSSKLSKRFPNLVLTIDIETGIIKVRDFKINALNIDEINTILVGTWKISYIAPYAAIFYNINLFADAKAYQEGLLIRTY